MPVRPRGRMIKTTKMLILILLVVSTAGCAVGAGVGASAVKGGIEGLSNCNVEYGTSSCQILRTSCRGNFSDWTTSYGEYGCSCCDAR